MNFDTFISKMDSVDESENTEKWLALEPEYYVKARDPSSGWGLAKNGSYYVIVLCSTIPDVVRVEEGLKKSGMKNVSWYMIKWLSSFPKRAGSHYRLYFAPETIWFENDGVCEYIDENGKYWGNKREYYEDRLSGQNKLHAHKTHMKSHKNNNLSYLKNSMKKMI